VKFARPLTAHSDQLMSAIRLSVMDVWSDRAVIVRPYDEP